MTFTKIMYSVVVFLRIANNVKEDSLRKVEEVMSVLKENPPKTGLDYIMRVRGITNAELGSQLSVEAQTVSGWRNGRIPNRESVLSLSEILGESPDYLFYQPGDWSNSPHSNRA